MQSSYGANEIIYCGYRFDPETELYYVRARTYNPTLGRWLQRDPIGYAGGVNLYEYVGGRAAITGDAAGLHGGFNPWGQPSVHWRIGRHYIDVLFGFGGEISLFGHELAGIGVEGSAGVSKVRTSRSESECRNEWIVPPRIFHTAALIPGGIIATTNTDFGVFSVNLMAGVWIGGPLVSIYEGGTIVGSYYSWSDQKCVCYRFDFDAMFSGQATLNKWALAGAVAAVAWAELPELALAGALQDATLALALIRQAISMLGGTAPALL